MKNNNNDIAIVGLGYVSSLGSGINTFFNKVENGLTTSKMDNYDPDGFMGVRGLRYFSNATKMFCNLAFQCIHQNNIHQIVDQNKERVGLYDGTELSNIEDGFQFDLVARNDGPDYVSPMNTPNTIANAAASQMAIQTKITGPNFSINGGAGSALQAIDVATMHLKDQIIDCALVGSTETTSKYHKAIREGEKRITQLPNSNEFGASIALVRVETAKENNQEILGIIDGVISGQVFENQTREHLIADLTNELLQQKGLDSSDVDMVMIGAGGHNISGTILQENFKNVLGLTPNLFFPESIYGNGDNAGGLASIIYVTGLFNKQINSVKGQFVNNILESTATDINPTNVVVVTIDKTGYAILTLVKKYI